MRYSRSVFAALTWWMASAVPGHAQSSPNLTYQEVPTAGQWNSYFAGKQDVLKFPPLSKNGDTLLGQLVTVASSALASGLNIAPGLAPFSPRNGDIWTTSGSVFAEINGKTYDLLHPAIGNLSGTLAYSQLPTPMTVVPVEQPDGVRTSFSLPVAVDPTRSAVTISGLYQQSGAYSLMGTSVTFAQAPPTGSVPAVVQGALPTTFIGSGSSGGITGAPLIYALTGDGTTTQFVLSPPPTTLDRYTVTVGGSPQSRTACQLTSGALNCVAPPPAAVAIDVTDGP